MDCGYGVSTNDPRICQNTTFWEDKPCRANQYRCNGKFPAQCRVIAQFGNNTCEDGSDRYLLSIDRYHLISDTTKCEAQGGLECPANAKLWPINWAEESYKIWNGNPSNSMFFWYLSEILTPVCFHSALKCDLYPQCEGGEDELREECEEEYVRKNIFTLEQTFKCSYPYHEFKVGGNQTKRLFTHRAIRCNGKPECWSGEDEEGCSTIDDISQYTIRELMMYQCESQSSDCLQTSSTE